MVSSHFRSLRRAVRRGTQAPTTRAPAQEVHLDRALSMVTFLDFCKRAAKSATAARNFSRSHAPASSHLPTMSRTSTFLPTARSSGPTASGTGSACVAQMRSDAPDLGQRASEVAGLGAGATTAAEVTRADAAVRPTVTCPTNKRQQRVCVTEVKTKSYSERMHVAASTHTGGMSSRQDTRRTLKGKRKVEGPASRKH